MSITIINQPTTGFPLQTVDSSTIYYQLNSTNSGKVNFKYICKVQPVTWSATYSYVYKVPPRPTNGWGLFAASDILKTYTSYTIWPNTTISDITHTPNDYIRWRTTFYEEYDPGKTFSDTVYSGGYLGLTFATTHGFGVNDVITIDKDNKVVNPEYDGTASVTSVPNAWQIVTDKLWGQNTNNEGGLITDVIKYSAPTTGTYNWGFNGTRQYEEVYDTFSIYQLGASSSTNRFLTKWDPAVPKKVFISDKGTMGFQTNQANDLWYLKFKTYDKNWSLLASYNSNASVYYEEEKSFDIPAGPENLDSAGVVFTSNVKYYTIQLRIFGLGPLAPPDRGLSAEYKFEIVENCSPYTNFRIMFQNSMGKMDYWNFNWLSKDTFDVDRSEFKKTLDFNYTIGDRGQTVMSQTVQENLYISSDWITEYESEYLKELIYSPEVYWMKSNGNIIPLVITDTNYEVKTALKDKLFCITLNVKMAYRQATQTQ